MIRSCEPLHVRFSCELYQWDVLSVARIRIKGYRHNNHNRRATMSIPNKQIGGKTFHVGDCYIWSAICYLDSPNDYREYLPQQEILPRATGNDLVMLDSSDNLPCLTTCFGVLSILVMLSFLVWGFIWFVGLWW